MLGLAVLALAQVERLLRHLDALFRHEHADDMRIGSDRVVQLHISPRCCRRLVTSVFEQAARVCQTAGRNQSSSLLRSRTDCMIGSKFERASSATKGCAVSSSNACDHWT